MGGTEEAGRWLRCPNCGNEKFYVEWEDGGMVFFRVSEDGVPTPTREPSPDLAGSPPNPVHCTSCSWYGGIDELIAPE